MERVRPLTAKPLIVKLTPNAGDVPAVARAAQAAGADAVSLINTLRGMALDPRTRRPWLGGGSGGVSGPAVRAVALAQVHAVAAAVAIPVIGMGGVQTGRHARDLLDAGATLVAVGTESFRDPAAAARISSELPPLSATPVAPGSAVSRVNAASAHPQGVRQAHAGRGSCTNQPVNCPANADHYRNHPRQCSSSG